MPVEGLPAALEAMLNAVLQDMSLSSYKIEGRGHQTVVVLRLTPSTTGQPPATQRSAVYRKKCPSQVNRDRQRAAAHRRSKEQASGGSFDRTVLFLPTPPDMRYSRDRANDMNHSWSVRNTEHRLGEDSSFAVPLTARETQQIDMPDTDRHAVTFLFEEGQIKEKDASEESSDGEGSMEGVSECATDTPGPDCAVGAVRCADSCSDVCEEDQPQGEHGEVTIRDIVECIERLSRTIDNGFRTDRDSASVTDTSPAVSSGNPGDPS